MADKNKDVRPREQLLPKTDTLAKELERIRLMNHDLSPDKVKHLSHDEVAAVLISTL
jgi:hypothetical protein